MNYKMESSRVQSPTRSCQSGQHLHYLNRQRLSAQLAGREITSQMQPELLVNRDLKASVESHLERLRFEYLLPGARFVAAAL